MKNDQYESLTTFTAPIETIHLTPSMFSDDVSDRTLLYGYDCDRLTWHLYCLSSVVMLHLFTPAQGTVSRTNVTELELIPELSAVTIIPNKRLYPERCDYDFCVWLKTHGVHLSFTDFDASRAVLNDSGFYGPL